MVGFGGGGLGAALVSALESLHLSDHAYGVWSGLAVDNTRRRGCRRALFGRSREARGPHQDDAQRAHWLRCAGLALYWLAEPGASHRQQSCIPWQKFPKIRLFSFDFVAWRTLAFFNKDQITALPIFPNGLCSHCGVGLRTNSANCEAAPKTFAVGAIGRCDRCLYARVVFGAQRVFHCNPQ